MTSRHAPAPAALPRNIYSGLNSVPQPHPGNAHHPAIPLHPTRNHNIPNFSQGHTLNGPGPTPTAAHLRPSPQKQLGDRRSTGSGSSGHTVTTMDSFSSALSASSSSFKQGTQRPSVCSVMTASTTATSTRSHASIGKSSSAIVEPHLVEQHSGRSYLTGKPYPYPIDFADMQRQNLQSLLAVTIVGRPLCGPVPPESAVGLSRPLEILDLGCGTGYMANLIHRYVCSLGLPPPNITGLDILPDDPFAPRPVPGMRWRYVRHDLVVRQPLPFQDSKFDIVFCKDMSCAVSTGPLQNMERRQTVGSVGSSSVHSTHTAASSTAAGTTSTIQHDYDAVSNADQQLMAESIRVLRVGGTLEFWDFDRSIRVLRSTPSSKAPPGGGGGGPRSSPTFFETDGMTTLFGPTKNPFLTSLNRWMMEVLNGRQVEVVPSTGMAASLVQEVDSLESVHQRRFAIPLGRCSWECGPEGPTERGGVQLQPAQAAFRNAALQLVLQTVFSIEPLIAKVSEISGEKWAKWKNDLMVDLLQNGGVDNGECFEMGVWWASKR